jgi:hypothetical protein
VFYATLTAKIELDLRAADADVTIAKRREPEGVVLPGVLLVSNPDKCRFQQPNDCRQDLAARELLCFKITRDATPYLWQSQGKGRHAVILRLIACFSPLRMVSVLFPSSRIAAYGLEMTFP